MEQNKKTNSSGTHIDGVPIFSCAFTDECTQYSDTKKGRYKAMIDGLSAYNLINAGYKKPKLFDESMGLIGKALGIVPSHKNLDLYRIEHLELW